MIKDVPSFTRSKLLALERNYLANRARQEFISAKKVHVCSIHETSYPSCFEISAKKQPKVCLELMSSSKQLKEIISKRKMTIEKKTTKKEVSLAYIIYSDEKEDKFAPEADRKYNRAVSVMRNTLDRLLITEKISFPSILEVEKELNGEFTRSFTSDCDSSAYFESSKQRKTVRNPHVSCFLQQTIEQCAEEESLRKRTSKLSFLENFRDSESEVTEFNVRLCYI